jgi:hypothetical protein
MDWQSNDSYTELYLEALFPFNICTPQLLDKSVKALRSAKKLTPLARRAWVEANDGLDRCIKVRAFDAKQPFELKAVD